MFDLAKTTTAQIAPNDTPNDIAFNPIHDYFSVSSWDGSLRLYSSPSLDHKLLVQENKPILCTAFDNTGNICFGGTSEGKIIINELQTSKTMNIDAHSSAIKSLKSFNNLIISGSFDRTIKFWDLRTPAPIHTINAPERVYAMDVGKDSLVVATATNKIISYDLLNNCQEKQITTKLYWQIRTIHAKEDGDTVLIGGVEGKLEILSKFTSKSNVVKLHRIKDDIYPINFCSTIPSKNIIATGGGDSKIILFDKNTHNKIFDKTFSSPVTCGSFNRNGTYFAYGIGYDWSKGYEVNNLPNGVGLINCSGMG